jgi:hypothetical protein
MHNHDIDPEHSLAGSTFRWTPEQTEMIIQGATNEANTKVRRRNMENSYPFSDWRVPTFLELSNKTCQKLLRRISDDLMNLQAGLARKKTVHICSLFLLVYFLNTYHFLHLKPKRVYFLIFNRQIHYLCTLCL